MPPGAGGGGAGSDGAIEVGAGFGTRFSDDRSNVFGVSQFRLLLIVLNAPSRGIAWLVGLNRETFFHFKRRHTHLQLQRGSIHAHYVAWFVGR